MEVIIMDYLIIFLITLKAHPILSFIVLIALGLIAPLFLPKKIKLPLFCGVFLIFSLCFVNVFMGHLLTNYLIDKFGDKGEGTVVDIIQTPNSFNYEPVLRYNVIINQNDKDMISTYCLTSDFNIDYTDSSNKPFSPEPGVKFNVKYIKNYPRAFVIIPKDTSDTNTLLMDVRHI